MKFSVKITTIAIAVLMLCAILAMGIFAEDATGYTFDEDGKTYTNIKWTFTEADKTVVFEIDEAATDKKASTVVYGFDPVSGKISAWNSPIQKGWGQSTGLKKAVFKEGITAIDGGVFALNRTVEEVVLPASLKTITGDSAFQGCTALVSVYYEGQTPESGVFDFSQVESFQDGCYVFDNCAKMKEIKLSSALTGELGKEFIKSTLELKELVIPEGVTALGSGALTYTEGLKTLTILGTDTTFSGNDVFNQNTVYPAIKAKAGSKAEAFAKINGYTFIDLDTGVETKGTKPSPVDSPAGSISSGVGLDAFDPEACTAYGYITGQYYDTYWVYYQDTKTLQLISNKSSGWNETGRIDFCEDKVGWSPYKQEIERIEIGPYIGKVTTKAFTDHTALKEVMLGKNVTQIDEGAFNGCTSLTTIWSDGTQKEEGKCNLSKIATINSIISDTSVTDVIISGTAKLDGALSSATENIYAPSITDAMIAYAKENGYNIINSQNPEERYNFFVPMPDDVIMCGDRCGYTFDEATGTITIHGSGAIADVMNYYGGGAKMSPWFSIKKQIKHAVIGDKITAIGKYCFTQCENLETVEIPASESFVIENAAFEKCGNLKAIYIRGTEPVEGTLDLRTVKELKAWTFAYDMLIANVVVNPDVTEISDSFFEENVNLQNVYGTPGSYAETWATENGKNFFDIASNDPQPIKCELPAGSETAEDTAAPDTETDAVTGDVETDPSTDDESQPAFSFDDETDPVAPGTDDESGFPVVIVIVCVVAVLVVAAVVVIVIKKKSKK